MAQSALTPHFFAHFWANFAWPWAHRNLIWQFARREVLGRYRGSVLGVGWAVLTPMAMLAVYTLVFRHIFKAKWPGVEDGNLSFALNLFAGLLVFNWAAEFLSRAPRLMTDQPNLVTKVVFPLQVLPWSALMSSFFHVLVSCFVWLAGCLLFGQGVHASWLALPLVFLALVPTLLGLGWALSALGVYFRDLGEIVGLFMGMLLFLTPVFFPLSVLPDFWQVWVQFNPLATPIEALRQIGLMGVWPKFSGLLQLFLIGLGVALDWMRGVGLKAIGDHENTLGAQARHLLEKVDGIRFIGTSEKRTGVVSFLVDGVHPYDIGTLLDPMGIAVRTGHHCTQPLMDFYDVPGTVRASFGVYNTLQEVDALAAGVERAVRMLR